MKYIEHCVFAVCARCHTVKCFSGTKSILDIRKHGWSLDHSKTIPYCFNCAKLIRAKNSSDDGKEA